MSDENQPTPGIGDDEAMTRAEAKLRLNAAYGQHVNASENEHVHNYVQNPANLAWQCECGDIYTERELTYMDSDSIGHSGSAEVGYPIDDHPEALAASADCVDVTNNFEYGYAQGFAQGDTPNIVIESPKARKIWNTVLSVIALVLASVSAFDATAVYIDLSQYLVSAWSVFGVISGAFGLTVVNSNIPKRKANPNA